MLDYINCLYIFVYQYNDQNSKKKKNNNNNNNNNNNIKFAKTLIVITYLYYNI